MYREKWDEMILQEEREEEPAVEEGKSYGEGIEKPRRPIGFGHEYRSRIMEGV
jgi:hypothetical protein